MYQPVLTSPNLVPPPELLFDGAVTAEEFVNVGEGFTNELLIKRARLQPHEAVLDMGSGNGQKARVLASYLNSEGRYEGLDVVQAGVDWCREAYRAHRNFSFQRADVYSTHYNPGGSMKDDEYVFPFGDASFDLVFFSSVFTHMLPDGVSNYLKETTRVLKPGGRYVATYFLLNEQSMRGIEAGRASIAFGHSLGACRVRDAKNPSSAVAHYEGIVRQMHVDVGLCVAEIAYGFWSGSKELLGALQDTILAVK
jgi:SAM-dependent methyltransferase